MFKKIILQSIFLLTIIASEGFCLEYNIDNLLKTALGFLPMAFSRGIGAEVQQPIAITVIGGIIFSTIATLILSPVLIKKTSKYF